MSSTSIDLYNTTAPYSYSEWSARITGVTYEDSVNLYHEYISDWYNRNNKSNLISTDVVKQDYISLLKELTYFFSEEEKDLFLKEIDFTNDTEIIYAIPYFVQKLKEVALTLSKKREYVKNNKKKFDSVGSVKTLENILYEYILKSHTKNNNTTQISISSLGSVFPDLSAVRDSFFIEVEEVYDSAMYSDRDPSIITNSYDEDLNIIPRLNSNPLFAVFADFLTQTADGTDNISLTSYSDYISGSSLSIYDNINANLKYIGNPMYGLTAVKSTDVVADNVTYYMYSGNNWFYWPSGEVFTDLDRIQNAYEPILLQDTVFTTSSATTAGATYTDSDLFFVENRGIIEGAWLRGSTTSQTTGLMVMTAQPDEIRSFIFPTPGYGLTNTYVYKRRVLDDKHLIEFNLLDSAVKATILSQYFSYPPNTDIAKSLYLNQSELVYSGANAGEMQFFGDTVLVRPGGPFNDTTNMSSNGSYNDQDTTQSAFLYKLTSSEIPITANSNYIEWPIYSSSSNIATASLKITKDTCNSIILGYIDVSSNMVGAIAGKTPDTADILYKLNTKNGSPIEAAWLHGGSTKDLATYNSYSVQVYNTSAVNCVNVPDGAIQPNLGFKCDTGSKVSFIWCDIDTPADNVFKFIPHAKDCPYLQTTHDYLASSSISDWLTCTCKSTHYSPIGHTGDVATDYSGAADFLFADPQGLGSNFTLTSWRDTRNLHYKNSPQFAFYQKANDEIDMTLGWGPGSWKTGNGKPMILKTGRRYTYVRSSLKNLNTLTLPPYIGYYPYKKIISSVQSSVTQDIILLIDVSGSEYFSIEKTKELAHRISNYVNVQQGSQIGIVIFNKDTVIASYLSTDRQTIQDAISLVSVTNQRNNTNILDGLKVSTRILQNTFGLNTNNSSLVGLCANLNIAVQTPFSKIKTANIPNSKNKKTIIVFSDGDENVNVGHLLAEATAIKSQNIKIVSVDIGSNSSSNSYMERIASSTADYFNYEHALLQNDSDNQIEVFASGIISNIYGNISMQPIWRKGALSGINVIATNDVSNMTISPGDYLQYTHKTVAAYDAFSTPSISFVIDVPLYGWNYNTKSFDGKSLGAKPYWGKVYNTPNDNFTKYAREIGGNIRYFDTYVPLAHPEVSNILLSTNDYIEYRNNGCDTVTWKNPITFTATQTDKQWLKLKVCTQDANLKELFSNNIIDKIFEQTDEPSDIILATFNEYTPSYYCYYARNDFVVTQPLTAANSKFTYSTLYTDIAIKPLAPYNNLTNTHYASIASKPYVGSNLITKDNTGYYLLPTNIGVPYILGRGFYNEIDTTKLLNYTGDLIFPDPEVYTTNMGLTKKEQFSPYKTVSIDNTWVKESYNSEKKAGVIINAIDYQKFVPYQSSYETAKHNIYGISRQDDKFEFWSGLNNNVWNDEINFPSNYKKETYLLEERTDSLLVTDKDITAWQTDMFGNNYGILKDTSSATIAGNKRQTGQLWVRDINNNISTGDIALSGIYINYIGTHHYSYLSANNVTNITALNKNTIVIQTPAGVSIDQIDYDEDTSAFSSTSFLPHLIDIEDFNIPGEIVKTVNVYGGMWYDELNKKIYINKFLALLGPMQIIYQIYVYDLISDNLSEELSETINLPVGMLNVSLDATFTYNKDTKTFNTTFIFNTPLSNFNIGSINAKNVKPAMYISNVDLAV